MIDKKKGRIGSSFDAFLKEEGRFEAAQAVAENRMRAWLTEQKKKQQRPVI